MCSPCVEYAVPAAIAEAIEPDSVMPSCRICPCTASLYDSSSSRSTAS
jgi:hypothetical protein